MEYSKGKNADDSNKSNFSNWGKSPTKILDWKTQYRKDVNL